MGIQDPRKDVQISGVALPSGDNRYEIQLLDQQPAARSKRPHQPLHHAMPLGQPRHQQTRIDQVEMSLRQRIRAQIVHVKGHGRVHPFPSHGQIQIRGQHFTVRPDPFG